MNKPATKEPSMDEILSSIRQIIADDDAAGAPRKPALQAAPDPMQAAPARTPVPDASDDELEPMAPLTLSAEQILPEAEAEPEALSFDALIAGVDEEEAEPEAVAPKLVVPDDIEFEVEDEPEPEIAPEPDMSQSAEPAFEPETMASEPAPPMPDASLSNDMTERLLEPATNAAVRSTFAKLNNLGLGNQNTTIESLMKDMLRPMLKEWLDENLPSVVERMVEKEIARVSRGE